MREKPRRTQRVHSRLGEDKSQLLKRTSQPAIYQELKGNTENSKARMMAPQNSKLSRARGICSIKLGPRVRKVQDYVENRSQMGLSFSNIDLKNEDTPGTGSS